MANQQWFRMYGLDYLSDPKMKALTASERSCWLTLLCYASAAPIPGEIRMSEKQLMIDSGVDPMDKEWEKTVGVLKKFDELSMVEFPDLLTIRIKNWNKRQFVKSTGYDRVKRHRIRLKTREQDERKLQEWFDTFWEAYPRKTAKAKALDAWNKVDLTQELMETILQALERQKKSPQWTKDGGQFIPHPTTWLNQERWADQLTIPSGKVAPGKYDNIKNTKI